MDSDFKLTPPPQVPMEPMDFLSRASWCNSSSAIQIFGPVPQDGSRAIVLHDHQHSIKTFENDLPKMEKRGNMDDGGVKSVPPWKSNNDLKSWIWMQQAMHPEVNYDRCFRKKWFSWKLIPFKNLSIKKWVKEIKQKRKEDDRLQRAEVHAAISVAGVAAALAAIAAENTKQNQPNTAKEAAMASAAALVAAQCAQVAEAMGAKREQLSSVMGSAMNTSTATDILTLTAAAATSLRGAATLRARPGIRRERLTGPRPILPIEDKDFDDDHFDFEKYKSVLAKGAELNIESSDDGKCRYRSVSIILNSEAKVILKTRKVNALSVFTASKESIILDLHAELYRDSSCEEDQEEEEEEEETSYYIVLRTNRGTIKLDMEDDDERYRMWAMTINHMLMLSTTVTGYELQFCRN